MYLATDLRHRSSCFPLTYRTVRVLLISTYELGHQPIGLASPAAWLKRSGYDVAYIDISVESFDVSVASSADAIAISVPMHTAARMALQLTENIRQAGITTPICLYGLYAHVASLSPAAGYISKFISGEYEPELVKWVEEISRLYNVGTHGNRNTVTLDRHMSILPYRDILPPLTRYARLSYGGREYLTGYLEATRGCAHKCLHCPVPSVYNGRIRKNDLDILLQDVDNLVSVGAEHITFGDPDFLNAPSYATSVLSAVHNSFPQLTFDLTIKVSHIVKYADLFPEIAHNGCLFVVSAFESASDRILDLLHKGHTVKDMEDSVRSLRMNGIEPRVSLMPFTPWTTRNDIAALLDMAVAFDIVPNIDPVQWSIRLLVPPGSLLLQDARTAGYFVQFDPDKLSYDWVSPDGELDVLQRDIEGIATFASEENVDCMDAFDLIRSRINRLFDLQGNGSFALEHANKGDGRDASNHIGAGNGCGSGNGYGSVISGLQSSMAACDRPRLTESWFCCAEPMQNQLDALGMHQTTHVNLKVFT